VALDKHRAPVTRIVAIALRQLKRLNPDLRLVVSFADPMQGHLGGIYQAGNWLYLGESMPDCRIQCRGKIHHPRSIGSIYGTRDINWLRKNVDPKAKKLADTGKFRYVYPLDRLIRKQLMAKTKPYPKELLQLGAESIDENTPNAA